MRHRRTIIMAATIGLLAATIAATPSSAAVPKPKIVAFNYPTAITRPNQVAEITGSIRGANTCTITITPPVIVGDGTFDCTGGDLATTIEFPQNTGRKPVLYTLTLHLIGELRRSDKSYKIKVWRDAAGGITKEIAAGPGNSCAVMLDRTAKCWGDGSQGQFGTVGGSLVPTPHAIGLSNVDHIAIGGGHICALLTDHTVYCWGRDTYGQLGIGSSGAPVATPTQVLGLDDAIQITAGYEHTCALRSGGTVVCWGSNETGQLGTGSLNFGYSVGPVVVSDMAGVTQISAGGYHTCAVLDTGFVQCWGLGQFGQLGNNHSGSGTCSSEHLYCFAYRSTVDLVTNAVEVASGGFHTCALNADQTVECWGLDDYGQLGIGEHGNGPCLGGRACQSEPYSLYLQGAAHLAAGIDHTCALLSNGNAVCWGSNDLGQLGVGGSTNGPCPGNVACADAPMPLTTLKNVTQIAAGHSAHTCVLLADKTVKCWGTDEVGELGDGNFGLGDYSSIPVAVIGP